MNFVKISCSIVPTEQASLLPWFSSFPAGFEKSSQIQSKFASDVNPCSSLFRQPIPRN